MGRPKPDAPSRTLNDFEARVAEVVRAIPPGHVSSYSQVAARAGRPNGARMVSRALGRVHGLPWWRVIQSGGTLAAQVVAEQARLLRKEGVRVIGRRVVTDESPAGSGAVPPPPPRRRGASRDGRKASAKRPRAPSPPGRSS